MNLMYPKHDEPLNVISRPLRPMPTVPAIGTFLYAELGLAYCGRCDDMYTYECDAAGTPSIWLKNEQQRACGQTPS